MSEIITTQDKTVFLVNPPNKEIVLRDMYSSTISKGGYCWPCVDLLVLSGILKRFYDVRIVDANTLRLSTLETVKRITSLNPLAVIFAFGNSVKEDDYNFVRELRKKLPQAKICGTGGLLYHNAEDELNNHREFDACLLNFTTDDIIKYIEGDYGNLNNMVYRIGDQVIKTPLKYPENNFSYSVPLHQQLPLDKYSLPYGKARPLTSVLTSYGCPFNCRFCVAEKIEYRYRSPDNVVEELRFLKKLGVREIFFRDNFFCANKQQGYELMNKMIENRFGFSWVADSRVNIINEQTAAIMKNSGCHALHMGVESASPQTLNRYNKGESPEQIRNAFRICREYGIKTVGYFIIGLPGETKEDILRTIDFSLELECDYASFNIALPIIGTSLRQEALDKGWLRANRRDRYDGFLGSLLEVEGLPAKEVLRLRNLAYRRFYLRPLYILRHLGALKNLFQTRVLFSHFLAILRRQF